MLFGLFEPRKILINDQAYTISSKNNSDLTSVKMHSIERAFGEMAIRWSLS